MTGSSDSGTPTPGSRAASAAKPARSPDFFIVGHAKCGTTALYGMLSTHPEVFMPTLKEPAFLASDMRPRFQSPMWGPMPTTIEEYLALFAGAEPGQRAGEASVCYLSSRTAASAISKLNPAARIIAIFREPANFLRSLHLQHLQNHNEDRRDLRRALALEVARRDGMQLPRRCYRPQALQYREHVRYTEQLERFHDCFPREQVLVLIYEELARDNITALRQILRFLDVDADVELDAVRANPTVLMRSQALDEVVHRFSIGRDPLAGAVKAGVKTLIPRRARRNLLHAVQRRVIHAPAPPRDEKLLDELRTELRGEVERLSAYLGRDLVSLWGYDQIG